MHTLAHLNRMDCPAFVAALGGVFEHSPWVARQAWRARPFVSRAALHAAMMQAVRDADAAARLGLLRAHPELAGSEAQSGRMTEHSTTEQSRLGLDALSAAEHARIGELNARYRERFGFPCIIALRLHADRASVFAEFESRLGRSPAEEEDAALGQIARITHGRLQRLVAEA